MQPNTSVSPTRENNDVIASSDNANFAVAPGACTVIAFNLAANNYITPYSDTSTVTVYQNSIATAMTCSVTTNGNGASCSDTTDTFTVAAGDTLSLQYQESTNLPLVLLTSTLVCQ
jgi:hypothetical protein